MAEALCLVNFAAWGRRKVELLVVVWCLIIFAFFVASARKMDLCDMLYGVERLSQSIYVAGLAPKL